MKKSSKIVFFSLCAALIIGLTFYFRFFLYCPTASQGDFAMHLKNIVYTNSKVFDYSLINIIMGWFASLGYDACAWIYSIIIAMAKVSMTVIIYFYLNSKREKFNIKNDWIIIGIAFALLFIGAISPIWNWGWGTLQYYNIKTPNVWHNPTFICMQPFALISFIYFEKFYFDKQKTVKNWMLFCLFLTLSAFMKPSFIFVFVPTLAIIFIISLIKNKFKNFKEIFIICCAFIPSMLVILYQYIALFKSEAGVSGDGFCFIVGGLPILTLPLLFLAPATIYIINHKRLDNNDKLSLILLLIGFIEGYFISESGSRAGAGNLTWQYLSAINLVFIFATINFLRNYKQMKRWQRILCIVFLSLHLICGIVCFVRYIANGGNYM